MPLSSLSKLAHRITDTALEWKIDHHKGLSKLKSAAKKLHKEEPQTSHMECLDIVAKKEGRLDWRHARLAVKSYYHPRSDTHARNYDLVPTSSSQYIDPTHRYLGYDSLLEVNVYQTEKAQRCHTMAIGPNAYDIATKQQWQHYIHANHPFVAWLYKPSNEILTHVSQILASDICVITIGPQHTTLAKGFDPLLSNVWTSTKTIVVLDDGSDENATLQLIEQLRSHIGHALGNPLSNDASYSAHNYTLKNFYFSNPCDAILEVIAQVASQGRALGYSMVYAYPTLDHPTSMAFDLASANTLTSLIDIEDTSKVNVSVHLWNHQAQYVISQEIKPPQP